MPRLLVFQHVAAEPLGTLDPLIRKRGHRIRFKNFERHPDAQLNVDRYRGLVVLGGPMNVEDHPRRPHLRNEMIAIERMLEVMRWVQWLEVEQRHLVWMRAKRYRWRDITIRFACDRTTAWRRWQSALKTVADQLNAPHKERTVQSISQR